MTVNACERLTLITLPEQILFFTGQYAEGCLVLGGEKPQLITDPRYFSAVKAGAGEKVNVVCGGDEELKKLVSGKRVAADYETLTVKECDKLRSFGAVVENGADEISKSLAVKSEAQLRLIKRACEIAETAYAETLSFIKEGVTELDVSAELEYRFKKHGAAGVSFETIVAFGEGSAVPHHKTGERRLALGEAVLMDFGCVYHGFMSDMTRTFYFGEPTEKFKKAYAATLSAHTLAAENIRAGMTGREADAIARDRLKSEELDKYFTHSLGHGVGTRIHESPNLSPRSEWTLSDGMVFSIEPGVYFDGEFGIRIEDTVTLSGGKVNSFMTYTKELITL